MPPPPSLVAVIANTHLPRGSRRLPPACVERLRSADLILHAGDLVSLAFLEELRGLGPPVEAVHGNVDEPAVREALPSELRVEVGGVTIGLVHVPGQSLGRHERLVQRFPGCGAVVYGHTHVPECERRGRVWMLNPGSPTERRRAPTHTMLMLEIAGHSIRPELIRLSTP